MVKGILGPATVEGDDRNTSLYDDAAMEMVVLDFDTPVADASMI